MEEWRHTASSLANWPGEPYVFYLNSTQPHDYVVR